MLYKEPFIVILFDNIGHVLAGAALVAFIVFSIFH